MLDKFYEICKFIACLCGTILIVLFTVTSIYIALLWGNWKVRNYAKFSLFNAIEILGRVFSYRDWK